MACLVQAGRLCTQISAIHIDSTTFLSYQNLANVSRFSWAGPSPESGILESESGSFIWCKVILKLTLVASGAKQRSCMSTEHNSHFSIKINI